MLDTDCTAILMAEKHRGRVPGSRGTIAMVTVASLQPCSTGGRVENGMNVYLKAMY